MTACGNGSARKPATKASKKRARTAKKSGIQPLSMSANSRSPRDSRAKNSTPAWRTSGSAKGSLMIADACLLAASRAAATMVAVAPTLLARSQASSSLRVTTAPSVVDRLRSTPILVAARPVQRPRRSGDGHQDLAGVGVA